MKKIYLLAGVLISSVALNAQQKIQNTKFAPLSKDVFGAQQKTVKAIPTKAEGDVLWSNDFGTASDWQHISGSSQSAGTTGQWQIVNAVPASLVSQAPSYGFPTAMNSTSGPTFAFIDSDGAGAAGVQDAYLQYTGTIDLSNTPAGTALYLEFTEIYRNYLEYNYVEVSIDGGTTWVQFEVNSEAEVPVNTNSLNPEYEVVNITSANAAGSANVKIRFYYSGAYDWFWGVDDVKITEAYLNDGKMISATMTSDPSNTQGCDYYLVPDNQLAAFPGHEFVVVGQNFGAATQNNFKARATSTGYNELSQPGVMFGNTLTPGATDTFRITTAFNPAASATPYNVLVSTDLGTTDSNIANDTTSFRGLRVGGADFGRDNGIVTSTLTRFGGTGNEIIGWFNYMNVFADYEVGSVKTYIPTSQPAGFTSDIVRAGIEAFDGENFTEVFSSADFTITPANFGSWLQLSGSLGPVVLTPGLYRVIFYRTEAADATLRLAMAQASPEGTVGGIKSSDLTTLGLASPNAIMIRMSPDSNLSVEENENNFFSVSMYPNPANDKVNISYVLDRTSDVTVTITDLSGKAVSTTSVSAVNAGANAVAVNTSDLSNGVYVVSLTANNQTSTHKLVIKK